jgi:hypothetical protein
MADLTVLNDESLDASNRETMSIGPEEEEEEHCRGSSTATTTTSSSSMNLDVTTNVSSSGTHTGNNKRKRVVLSIHEKQQVLQRLELGEQPVLIARDFGISRQQVSDIKKNKDRILSFCIDAKHLSSLRRKTLKATSEYHPGVEQELYRWLIRQRRLDRMVTNESITTKATDLFMQYSADDSTISFKAIGVWLRNFKRTHGIRSLSQEELLKLPEKFISAMDSNIKTHMTGGNIENMNLNLHMEDPASHFMNVGGSNHNNNNHHHSTTTNIMSSSTSHSTSLFTSTGSDGTTICAIPATNGDENGITRTSSQMSLETIQLINAQMLNFEKIMMEKLDFLEARIEKICFSVFPPRFT